MKTLNSNFSALRNKHTSEANNTGATYCKNEVIIHHKDTLGRPLPIGIVVNVYDSTGKVHSGIIGQNGISRHGVGTIQKNGEGTPQVKCGEISWQLKRSKSIFAGKNNQAQENSNYGSCENHVPRHLSEKSEAFEINISDGYVLIKAEADGKVVTNEEPQFQLSNPLKIEASWQNGNYRCHIYATYLPQPMLLNLRFLQECDDKLKKTQIDAMISQIKLDGGTTTLFIHGYNVPLGKTGRFPTYEETVKKGTVRPNMPLPPYQNPIATDEMQAPWLHYGREDLLKIIEGNSLTPNKRNYTDIDLKFNGNNALSWFPNVEYYLNLAASGKDKLDKFTDWEKYSRIVGVTWSGSVSSTFSFFLSEIYANESGRELAKVLIKLFDAGIKVNIITHSLGARVALSALNILGDFDGKYDEEIDNLIMWEPAVADNAFTNTYKREMNPIAMDIFPFAHKATKRMTVLYSTEDGVVDGDKQWWDGEPSGIFGGAYPKKYSKFFSILTKGTKPLSDYYKSEKTKDVKEEYEQIRQIVREFRCDSLGGNRDMPSECSYIKADKQKIRNAIEAEADKLTASNGISDEVYYLRPWSCFRRLKKDDPMHKEILEHIIDIMTYIVENNWQANDVDIRPPMGARGDLYTVQGIDEDGKQLSKKEKAKYYDEFIDVSSDINDQNRKIDFFPQTVEDPKDENKTIPYFISHSAMREWEYEWVEMLKRNKVFPTIYEKSYKEWIVDRIVETSTFGRY